MNTKTKQGGLGIVSILTIVFIVLKLSGVIKWHWIWVLSPIWISALTAVVLFAGILAGGRLKKGKWCTYLERGYKIGSGGQVQSVLARLVCRKAKRAAAVNGAKRSS